MTKANVKELPFEESYKVHRVTSFILFPRLNIHESGYAIISVICVDKVGKAYSMIGYGDTFAIEGEYRIECLPKSKLFHFWCPDKKFAIDARYSTIKIKTVEER